MGIQSIINPLGEGNRGDNLYCLSIGKAASVERSFYIVKRLEENRVRSSEINALPLQQDLRSKSRDAK